MTFDFTDLETGISTRYKPRGHATCEAALMIEDRAVGGLGFLTAAAYPDGDRPESGLASGRFILNWHRPEATLTAIDELAIYVAYVGPDGSSQWFFPDLQLSQAGQVLRISSLSELLRVETSFFSRRPQARPKISPADVT